MNKFRKMRFAVICLVILFYESASSLTSLDEKLEDSKLTKPAFPDDFLFGSATAAYQIEGGWNADGKGPSIWDDFTHEHPEKIADHQNADIGPNSYEFYKDDVNILKHLNMSCYRFSIAWSRVLPTGDISNVNEKGIEYYNNLINALLEHNIKPMITMYHWDLPSSLQKLGGFANPLIADYFEDYANLLFQRFGDRVKYWITFNEPDAFCTNGYGRDFQAPGINAHGIGEYLCGHTVLKAHAAAYRLYKQTYFEKFNGKVGITLNSWFYYPDLNDTDAADRAIQFQFGWYANPIFSAAGNYPDTMIKQIANNSKQEGRSRSRLPVFSEQEIGTIRGSADFLGLNYYTGRYVRTGLNLNAPDPSSWRDSNVVMRADGKPSASFWHYSVPKGLGDLLRWIKNQYNNPEIIITENGWSDRGGLEDDGRIEYLHDHLKEILNAILDDGVNVTGYTVWSIIDNFEWHQGYTESYGIYAVNMTAPRRERTPKKSAAFMKTVVATHKIPDIITSKVNGA